MTHTYAVLTVSTTTFEEIRRRLTEAGHAQAVSDEDGEPTIDMHGLALRVDPLAEFALEPGGTDGSR